MSRNNSHILQTFSEMHFNRNLILAKKEFIPHSRRKIERARGEIMNTQSFA